MGTKERFRLNFYTNRKLSRVCFGAKIVACQLYLKTGGAPAVSWSKEMLNAREGFFGCKCMPHVGGESVRGF